MNFKSQDVTLTKLREERSRLEDRLRLLETDSSRGHESVTETPETVREQINQVDRMIASHTGRLITQS